MVPGISQDKLTVLNTKPAAYGIYKNTNFKHCKYPYDETSHLDCIIYLTHLLNFLYHLVNSYEFLCNFNFIMFNFFFSPVPDMEWKRPDGTMIVEKRGKYEFLDKGHKRTLKIKDLDINDEGEFTCLASNQQARGQATVYLNVTCEYLFQVRWVYSKSVSGVLISVGLRSRTFIFDLVYDLHLSFRGSY